MNNRIYVIDASFVLSFLLPDEISPETNDIFTDYEYQRIKLTSTYLLPFEVFNSFNIAVRRKRLDYSVAKKLAQQFMQLSIVLKAVDFIKTLELANKYKLSVYDAAYVQLARGNQCPLLTLDTKLQAVL